jgi:hypothetical protein
MQRRRKLTWDETIPGGWRRVGAMTDGLDRSFNWIYGHRTFTCLLYLGLLHIRSLRVVSLDDNPAPRTLHVMMISQGQPARWTTHCAWGVPHLRTTYDVRHARPTQNNNTKIDPSAMSQCIGVARRVGARQPPRPYSTNRPKCGPLFCPSRTILPPPWRCYITSSALSDWMRSETWCTTVHARDAGAKGRVRGFSGRTARMH